MMHQLHLPNNKTERSRCRPSGRTRRPAKVAAGILAELPPQIQRAHAPTTPSSSKPSDRSSTKRRGRRAAPRQTVGQPAPAPEKAAAPPRGHVRRDAMVWDDLVSVVRLEVRRLERERAPHAEAARAPPPVVARSGTGDVASPPRIARVAFCFNAGEHSSDSWSPSPVDDAGIFRTFLARDQRVPDERDARPGYPLAYFSDTDDETSSLNYSDSSGTDNEASSLEYSDIDSDVASDVNSDAEDSAVERAIFKSAGIVPCAVASDPDADGGGAARCAICLDRVGGSRRASVSGCNHTFCFGCIDEWAERKSECPLCKQGFHWVVSQNRVRWY